MTIGMQQGRAPLGGALVAGGRAVAVAVTVVALASCGGGHAKAARSHTLGPVTKAAGCGIHGGLPDRACTPGAVLVGVGLGRLCAPGYTAHARHVTLAGARVVYRSYGLPARPGAAYKLDHLVSRGLAGANARANLWPAPTRAPGFYEKQALANYLHDRVCARRLPLARAQREIAADWLVAYRAVGARTLRRYRSRTAP
jgi:hypothetical protein